MVRPKHFPNPFPREHQDVLIQDRIWFAPEVRETPFRFMGFEDPSLFGKKGPIALEYCSGNGIWIAAKAEASPDRHFLAVEMKWKRIKRIWSKIQNHSLSNLIGVCGEAFSWTKRFIPDASIDQVYINFPDPWPKKKHTKYRLINSAFLLEVARILQPGGEFTVVTDHIAYSESIIKLLLSSPHFTPLCPDPYFLTEWEGYGSSYFEEIWRNKGLDIRYIPFRRK
jgi:tRNA (guanine-N7-)-methyltransferase